MLLSDLSEVAQPGTPAFFPSLLSRIHSANPTLPVDSAIVQSILLCLISGDKHLILRTQLEDVSLVLKLATVVSSEFSFPVSSIPRLSSNGHASIKAIFDGRARHQSFLPRSMGV